MSVTSNGRGGEAGGLTLYRIDMIESLIRLHLLSGTKIVSRTAYAAWALQWTEIPSNVIRTYIAESEKKASTWNHKHIYSGCWTAIIRSTEGNTILENGSFFQKKNQGFWFSGYNVDYVFVLSICLNLIYRRRNGHSSIHTLKYHNQFKSIALKGYFFF